MIQGLSGTVSSFVDDTRVKKSINNADTGAECQELPVGGMSMPDQILNT